MNKPLLIRFTEAERKMIEAIQKANGLSTGSAVIRFLIYQEYKKLSK